MHHLLCRLLPKHPRGLLLLLHVLCLFPLQLTWRNLSLLLLLLLLLLWGL
jgi:hypothetical protein